MKFIKSTELSKPEKKELLQLWNNEYPEKLNYNTIPEFENYLESLHKPNHILVKDKEQKVKGWYCDFLRENEKWFAILLNSEVQGKGLGTKILNLSKEKEIELNGWVIDHNNYKKKNGEIYESPLAFYTKNGFKKLTENRLETGKISAIKIQWRK